jgi:hypothetical protein
MDKVVTDRRLARQRRQAQFLADLAGADGSLSSGIALSHVAVSLAKPPGPGLACR